MSTKTVLFAAAALAGAAYVSAQAAPAWQYVSVRALPTPVPSRCGRLALNGTPVDPLGLLERVRQRR
jgi:hypothetical protein